MKIQIKFPQGLWLYALGSAAFALLLIGNFRMNGRAAAAAAQAASPGAETQTPAVRLTDSPGDTRATQAASEGQSAEAATELPLAIPPLRLAILPDTPRPGEPLTVGLGFFDPDAALPDKRYAVLLNKEGKKLAQGLFFPLPAGAGGMGRAAAAILAVPSTAAPGPARVRLEPALSRGPVIEDLPLIIGERDFASEVIDLDQRNTAIRVEPDPQKTAESSQLWAILSRTNQTIYAEEAFLPPVDVKRRTSFYGDRRVYRYVNGRTEASIHAGVDYGAPLGTPVSACARGKVVLARSRIVTGYSVVLEHLPGVYSLYYHLDSIAVQEGGMADAGTLLGRSGATGLATGPHLHWEIRAAGENADPDAFIARPVLDKDAIMGKLKAFNP
jgi:murein DD-endopeptidase MepM/ murein hydrolase activator NlpD